MHTVTQMIMHMAIVPNIMHIIMHLIMHMIIVQKTMNVIMRMILHLIIVHYAYYYADDYAYYYCAYDYDLFCFDDAHDCCAIFYAYDYAYD